MKKNWKTMALPIVGVVALAVGSIAGFDQSQIDTLKGSLDNIITAIATIVSVYGIWKSHDKQVK